MLFPPMHHLAISAASLIPRLRSLIVSMFFTRTAHAAAAENRPLGIIDAQLAFAVVVRIARDAQADRAGNERLGEWMVLVDIGDGQTAITPAERIVALPDATLEPLEVWQHVR